MEDRKITRETGFDFGLRCGSKARFVPAGRNTLVLGSAKADTTELVKSYTGSNEDAAASSRDDLADLWLRFGIEIPSIRADLAKWGFTISILDLPVNDGPAFRAAFVGENGSDKVCESANMTLRKRALRHTIKTGDHAGK
jgi:hypothetical protein